MLKEVAMVNTITRVNSNKIEDMVEESSKLPKTTKDSAQSKLKLKSMNKNGNKVKLFFKRRYKLLLVKIKSKT